jgi:hypothetical protein
LAAIRSNAWVPSSKVGCPLNPTNESTKRSHYLMPRDRFELVLNTPVPSREPSTALLYSESLIRSTTGLLLGRALRVWRHLHSIQSVTRYKPHEGGPFLVSTRPFLRAIRLTETRASVLRSSSHGHRQLHGSDNHPISPWRHQATHHRDLHSDGG